MRKSIQGGNMEELLNLKKEIANLQNDRAKLAHERDAKRTEAEQITDKNSNFYKMPIKEANDIQIKINNLGEKAENLRKKFDESLKLKKEEELKKLEKEKAELDKIGLINKEDKINKIKELEENQKALLADIKKRESSIKELNERIDRQHITNPKDVLIQSLDGSKKIYEEKKKEFEKSKNDLKYLSVEDPRAEFLKIEKQITRINGLNYDNLDEFVNDNTNDSKDNADNNLNNQNENVQSVDTEFEIEPREDNVIDKTEPVNIIEKSDDKENNSIEKLEKNAAESDLDIQSQPEKLDKFNERQEKVRNAAKTIKQNINKENEEKDDGNKKSYLTKSLTDLQIKEQKSYTETFKRMEEEVDRFYRENKEFLEGASIEDLNKVMGGMSNDAAMLLERRMKKEHYIENENIEERKSVLDKIKSIFSRNNKETKALAKQSKFKQLFNSIKDKFSKIANQNEEDKEKSTETEISEKDGKQKKIGDALYEKFGKTSSHQTSKNKNIEQARKEMNIDVPIDKEHDEY